VIIASVARYLMHNVIENINGLIWVTKRTDGIINVLIVKEIQCYVISILCQITFYFLLIPFEMIMFWFSAYIIAQLNTYDLAFSKDLSKCLLRLNKLTITSKYKKLLVKQTLLPFFQCQRMIKIFSTNEVCL
jgi:hypothetical protein